MIELDLRSARKVRRICRAPALLLSALIAPLVCAQSANFTNIYSFSGGADGSEPQPIIQGADGNFYGTTLFGGSNGNGGTLFRLTPFGTRTTLYSFPGYVSLGQSSSFALIVFQGKDGSLYGTTQYGAVVNNQLAGTLFKYSPDGTLTTLCTYPGFPLAGLILASDGNLYGMITSPAENAAVLFKVALDCTFTVLHTFTGLDPAGSLIEGPTPLTFYGAVYSPSGSSQTTIFSATPTGVPTNVVSFPPNVGTDTLTVGPDQALYGITGGPYLGDGTVFRLASDGTVVTLHSFAFGQSGGGPPGGPVLFGSDGTLYGDAGGGSVGAANCATIGCDYIYTLTPNGTVSVVYPFTGGEDGTGAGGGALMIGHDGALYGTSAGGTYRHGNIFRIALPSDTPPATPPAPAPGSNSGSGGGSVEWLTLLALAGAVISRARGRRREDAAD
jgi:uncharacterized repeat protein (TIGR03803 family)